VVSFSTAMTNGHWSLSPIPPGQSNLTTGTTGNVRCCHRPVAAGLNWLQAWTGPALLAAVNAS